MKVRGRFSERVPVVFVSSGVDRTKQSFKEQTDINHIMGRYLKSGNVDWTSKYPGTFGELEPQTFHEAMNVVAKAKEMFADLPSEVRKRFGNEPGEFLKFMNDPANLDEMRKLKLVLPEPEPEIEPAPRRVVVVSDETRFDDSGEVPAAPKAPGRVSGGARGGTPPGRRSPPTQVDT